MAASTPDNLLARLAGQGLKADPTSDPWQSIAATVPQHAARVGPEAKSPPAPPAPPPKKEDAVEQKLNSLLQRINRIAGGSVASTAAEGDTSPTNNNAFVPIEPSSFLEAGVTDSQVEGLILKLLLARGSATGREIAEHICLVFRLIEELLRQMKQDRLVVHRGAAPMNDYVFELSDLGRERARRLAEQCTYYGSAPVPLKQYCDSVAAQSLAGQHPTQEDVARAFNDLLINPRMLRRLGPAINSGRGLFLYGAPGNGKTSIAERVTRAFGSYIWIPKAIGCDGDIIRVYDPSNHELAPTETNEGLLDNRKIDNRWVRIVRPTIVVGGELTMANLEVSLNLGTGISEAPLQMKSNCGTLVIDDFGRQRMSTDELLNRWIVPLEKRFDYLNLPGGKKIQVPFDQLIVFSTNLEPKDLVDDAFLRRIPYKIEVQDPAEPEFKWLFQIMAEKFGIEFREDAYRHLIDKHYVEEQRPFRCCHPRDLLLQVVNLCNYENRKPEMNADTLDFAVDNYFGIME